MSDRWHTCLSFLKRLKEQTDADDVSLVVTSIPMKLEIDPQEYRRVLDSTGLASNQLDIAQPLRHVSSFADAEGITMLDPRSAIRQRHAETPCYFVYDGHWIGEGIRVAVESLARQWLEAGLPPFDTSASQRDQDIDTAGPDRTDASAPPIRPIPS